MGRGMFVNSSSGISEFPQNEKLLITLAETLSEAGWRECGEWLYYGGKGYIYAMIAVNIKIMIIGQKLSVFAKILLIRPATMRYS